MPEWISKLKNPNKNKQEDIEKEAYWKAICLMSLKIINRFQEVTKSTKRKKNMNKFYPLRSNLIIMKLNNKWDAISAKKSGLTRRK